jgi:ribosomal protein S18 acetylase RimI-like enzyme
MASPKGGYYIDGVKVPGTTTIIGRFKESGGLLQWAFKQGQSGVGSLYEKRDEAADIGTRAHSLIERHINGEDLTKILQSEESEQAVNAFKQYLKWERQTKLKLLSKYQEVQLVSPTHQFGGTPDAIGEIDGEILLLDWKTSNGVYPDYLIQLAAYQHLVNDGYVMSTGQPLGLKVGKGAHLLRFSKEFADFGHHYYGDLSAAWRQFELYREAYDIDQILKKRA